MASRSEERVIRPFVGLEDFASIFEDVTLRVGEQKANPKLYLEPEKFREATLNLTTFWNPKKVIDALAILKLDPNDVHFAVYLLGKTLKEVMPVRDIAVSMVKNPESAISISYQDAPRVLGDNLAGYDVVVALYLKKSRESKPLTVYEEGTWLAKTEFTIRPDRGLSMFSPLAMNAEQKKTMGIPKKTMFFLEAQSESLFHATDVDRVFKFWVDDRVYTELQDERSKAAQAMALLMVRQALSGIIGVLSRNLVEFPDLESAVDQFDSGAFEESVASRLVSSIKKKLPNSDTKLVFELAKHDPERLVALLDDAMNLSAEVLKVSQKDED
jgi:hypothetical protein